MNNFAQNLLLHQRTKTQIDNFLAQPAHALLLTGPAGSGKYTLARAIAADLLRLEDAGRLSSYPYYVEVSPPEGKQEIPIDAVRVVIHNLRLKAPGKEGLQRIVFINDAHSLSSEAQNALLKTLEEPGSDTAFILTAPSAQAVAPTIASRAQGIAVYPVTRPAALAFYQSNQAEAAIASNWLLSGGSAGLLSTLFDDNIEHLLKDAVGSFKQFLGSNTYQRLLYCDSLAKDKVRLANFLEGGRRVLRALHQNAVKNGNDKQSASLAKGRKLIGSLQDKLETNASPRLVATSLAINLKL